MTAPVVTVSPTDTVVETLAYNETMGDWRTHSGLDITADLGAKVLSTANGVVSHIYQDDTAGLAEGRTVGDAVGVSRMAAEPDTGWSSAPSRLPRTPWTR